MGFLCVAVCFQLQWYNWFIDAVADITRLRGQMWEGTKQTPVSERRWHHACFPSCSCPKSTVKLRSDYWYRQCPRQKSFYFSIFIPTYRLSVRQQSVGLSVKTVNRLLFPLSSLFSRSLLCYSASFIFFLFASELAQLAPLFWITWLWRS